VQWRGNSTDKFFDLFPVDSPMIQSQSDPAAGSDVLLNVPTTARSSVAFHAILNWTAMLKDEEVEK